MYVDNLGKFEQFYKSKYVYFFSSNFFVIIAFGSRFAPRQPLRALISGLGLVRRLGDYLAKLLSNLHMRETLHACLPT